MTKYAIHAGGNWGTDGTWSSIATKDVTRIANTVKPTAGDDVVLDDYSGNVTINIASVCRSLDCSAYTTGQILLHNAFLLSIGDGTAGAGNKALDFSGAFTYTIANVITSAISFVSTSATQQTVNFNGKTTGNVDFTSPSVGSWKYMGGQVSGPTASITFNRGSLDTNGQTLNVGYFISKSGSTRVLNLGASDITVTANGNVFSGWDVSNTAGLTFNGGTSIIRCTGAQNAFAGGSLTYPNVILSGTSGQWISNSSTFVNLSLIGPATKGSKFACFTGGFTVTGIFTITGQSIINRLYFTSDYSQIGNPLVTITNTGATMVWSNVDLENIKLTTPYDAHGISGGAGDCGGNVNITFTDPADQVATMSTNHNWSDAIWSGSPSRVPLPQDNVSLAGVSGGTLTADMLRLGKSIDWTSATGNPIWNLPNNIMYGSLTLISGMSISGAGILTFSGVSAFTITSAGKILTLSFTVNAPRGTYTLQDDLNVVGSFNLNHGAFDANNHNVTCAYFQSGIQAPNGTRSLTMGNGIWTLTSTVQAAIWNIQNVTNYSFSGASSIITISNPAAITRTFGMGTFAYGTLNYIVNGSTGELDLLGVSTFAAINFSDNTNPRTLGLPAGATQTITTLNGFNVNGLGQPMTVKSTTPGSIATLSSSSNQNPSFLWVHDITAAGGGAWKAWSSYDMGHNSGWDFSGLKRYNLTPVAPIQPNDASISSNLILWLDANQQVYSDLGTTPAIDGDLVEQWNDLSGNANPAKQTTSAKRPFYKKNVLNGLPVIRFVAANSTYLDCLDSVPLSPATAIHMMVVMIPTVVQLSTIQGLITKDISGALTNPPYNLQLNNGNVLAMIITSSGSATTGPGKGSLQSRQPVILEGTYDSIAQLLYLNGSLLTSSANTVGMGDTTGNLHIGQQKDGMGRYYTGDIAEIIMYNTVLSTSKRQGIEAYLAQKWGMPTPTNRGGISNRILLRNQVSSFKTAAAGDYGLATSVGAQDNLHQVSWAGWVKNDFLPASLQTTWWSKGNGYLTVNLCDTQNIYLQAKWTGSGGGKWTWSPLGSTGYGKMGISLRDWHFYVFTYDDTNIANKPNLFIDTQPQGTPTVDTAPLTARAADTNAISLGALNSGSSAHRGKLLDVQYYGKILSQAEINQIYYSGIPASGIVARWPCNEGSGTTLIDLINGANATINGGTAGYSTDIPLTSRSAATGRTAIL